VTFLLDVNVLISLIDPTHVGHDAAHNWFREVGAASLATCPLTENGVIRVVGHPKYPIPSDLLLRSRRSSHDCARFPATFFGKTISAWSHRTSSASI
jgi:predicted nucleic acid-binding protein